MSRASLEGAIPAGARVLLDSSALIAYLYGKEPASPVAGVVMEDFITSGRNTAVISAVSVMEILVRPIERQRGEHHHVLSFVQTTPHLSIIPVDVRVAYQAAIVRAALKFKAPDALITASGIVAQASILIGNDAKWKALEHGRQFPIGVCYLEDHMPIERHQ